MTIMLARMPSTSCAMITVIEERRTVAALGLEHDAVDHVADDARQEDDERVHDALDQRERHHVAVRDVADLVAEHGFRLAAATCRSAARC